jgi:SAM-dependent MidA family methyltransferase
MSGDPELKRQLVSAIESGDGAMGFDEFMGTALYDAAHGYYAQAGEVTGRAGDFYTSVSVGKWFGTILAAQFEEVWERMGRPAVFDLVEQGANDGRLADDVLSALAERWPACFEAVQYGLVEPLSRVRAVQEDLLLPRWEGKVRWWCSVEEMPVIEGIFFCNELVDAFPVKRVRWEEGAWRELRVGVSEDDGAFCWRTGVVEPGTPLAAELEGWGTNFREGYTTEVNLAMVDWMKTVAERMAKGLVLVIDYGHEEEVYLAPDREEGTLRCYRGHRAGDDPLVEVGEQDITSHVNFTRLAKAAEDEGLLRVGLVDQHHFMTGAAVELLQAMEGEPDAAFGRQFQTLTHPGLMGRAFKVALFARGLNEARTLRGLQFA